MGEFKGEFAKYQGKVIQSIEMLSLHAGGGPPYALSIKFTEPDWAIHTTVDASVIYCNRGANDYTHLLPQGCLAPFK